MMSYAGVAQMHSDGDLWERLVACVATEGFMTDPARWVNDRLWLLVAQPGWSDAYEYAVAASNTRPGWDGAVITDAMILTAVQSILYPSD